MTLSTHLLEDIRVLSHEYGDPDNSSSGGVLAGKQEVHYCVSHCSVRGVGVWQNMLLLCLFDLL